MTSISNIKIGRKIALVLGGTVLLLTGLSALSLWGIHANEKATVTLIQRLTKARLAEEIQGYTAATGKNKAQMIIEKNAGSDLVSQNAEIRKDRAAALEQFRALADTPTSIKQGADMADLIEAVAPANERMITSLTAGRTSDAVKDFRAADVFTSALATKAKEAAKFQLDKVAVTEKSREETSNTIWMSLILGCLFAIAEIGRASCRERV